MPARWRSSHTSTGQHLVHVEGTTLDLLGTHLNGQRLTLRTIVAVDQAVPLTGKRQSLSAPVRPRMDCQSILIPTISPPCRRSLPPARCCRPRSMALRTTSRPS